MVCADGMIGDDLQPVGQVGDDVSGKTLRMAGEHRIRLGRAREKLGAGKDMVVLVQPDVVVACSARLDGIGQPPRDEEDGLLRHGG